MATEGKGDAKVTSQPITPDHEKKVSATTTKPTPAPTPRSSPTPTPTPTTSADNLSIKPSATSTKKESASLPSATTEATKQSNEFTDAQPRQVIAVSASKNPAAFFNLARRFLVTDEYCDLSALEGAIVSAVDAAHLLERSKLAHIVRIQTSYVTVEPRKKSAGIVTPAVTTPSSELGQGQHQQTVYPPQYQPHGITHTHKKPPHTGKKGNPLRRSRIIITVKRTEDYKKWLLENDVEGDNSTVPPLS